MSKKKTKRKMAIITGVILVLSIIFYQPFINYLVTQAANPNGIIGGVMTKIWSGYFEDQTTWAFSLIDLNNYDRVLSVGYGSGSNIKYIKDQSAPNTVYGVVFAIQILY